MRMFAAARQPTPANPAVTTRRNAALPTVPPTVMVRAAPACFGRASARVNVVSFSIWCAMEFRFLPVGSVAHLAPLEAPVGASGRGRGANGGVYATGAAAG